MAVQISGSMPETVGMKSVDGKLVSLSQLSDKILVVIFSCNHCPYVQAYEKRYIALQAKYASKGVKMVAINSNDAERYPADSFENMAARSKEQGYNFDYLHDSDQSVAKAFGATNTPHVFLFDEERILRYTGRIDDCWEDEFRVRRRDLEAAIDQVLIGVSVDNDSTLPVGCSIKWK